MKYFPIPALALIAACFASCGLPVNKHAFPFPDTVVVKPSAAHVQISGTRIFVVPPKGAKQDSVHSALLIDRQTNIHFVEHSTNGFGSVQQLTFGRMLQVKAQQPGWPGLLFHKYFKQGKDSGLMAYGKDPAAKTGKIVYVIGSPGYSLVADARYPIHQPALRDEIIRSLQTAFIDTTVLIDYSANSMYTVDTVGTTFRFQRRENEFAFYTSEALGGMTRNLVTVNTVPMPVTTDGELKDAVDMFLSNIRRIEKLEPRMVATKIRSINGTKAIECTFTIYEPGASRHCVIIIMTSDRGTLFFKGAAAQGETLVFSKMIEFAQSIRLK